MKIPEENDFRKAHALIRKSRTVLEATEPDRYGRVGPGWRDECVEIITTKLHLRRSLLLLDAILRGVEAKGHKAEVVREQGRFYTHIKIGSEFVRIRITEKTTRNREKYTSSHDYIYDATGVLTFSIEGLYSQSWMDLDSEKLESRTGEIVEGIVMAGENLQLRRIEQEEEDRRYEEKCRKEEELNRLWEREKTRRKALEQQAENWSKVTRLSAFIGACEAQMTSTGKLISDSPEHRWVNWARRYVDEIDPLKNGYLLNAVKSLPKYAAKIKKPASVFESEEESDWDS
jgi:hypothetical protein